MTTPVVKEVRCVAARVWLGLSESAHMIHLLQPVNHGLHNGELITTVFGVLYEVLGTDILINRHVRLHIGLDNYGFKVLAIKLDQQHK